MLGVLDVLSVLAVLGRARGTGLRLRPIITGGSGFVTKLSAPRLWQRCAGSQGSVPVLFSASVHASNFKRSKKPTIFFARLAFPRTVFGSLPITPCEPAER